MKILLYSLHGDGIALINLLKEEGNKVDLFILNPTAKTSYEGMANKVSKPNFSTYDIVVFDMVGKGKLADMLKAKAWGASRFMDKIELDRKAGIEFMNTCNIKTPPTFYFNSVKEAIVFLKHNKDLFVMKPLGNKDTSLTYVPDETNEEVIDMLNRYKADIGKLLLQKKIDGIEMSTEMWFYKGKLIKGSINNTLETKKFLSGDLGQNTGCANSLVWKNNAKNIEQIAYKIEKNLPKEYSGVLDLNAIWQGNEPYGLEWTARLGYSAIYALCEILKSKLSDAFVGKKMELKAGFGYAVRVSIPPYPVVTCNKLINKKLYLKNEGEIIQFPNKDSYHIWLLDAKEKNGNYVVAGIDGVIAEVTAYTKKFDNSPKQLIDSLDSFNIPNKQYRNDLFIPQEKRLKKLSSNNII